MSASLKGAALRGHAIGLQVAHAAREEAGKDRATLVETQEEVARLERILVALTADMVALRFGVDAHLLFRPGFDRTPKGRRVYKARAVAVSLLHTAVGFSLQRAADAFGMAKSGAWRHQDKVASLREDEADLDAWLEALEVALAEAARKAGGRTE